RAPLAACDRRRVRQQAPVGGCARTRARPAGRYARIDSLQPSRRRPPLPVVVGLVIKPPPVARPRWTARIARAGGDAPRLAAIGGDHVDRAGAVRAGIEREQAAIGRPGRVVDEGTTETGHLDGIASVA